MKLPRGSSSPALFSAFRVGPALRRLLFPRRGRWPLLLGIAALGAMGAGGWFFLANWGPVLSVPAPDHPDQLEPQLREYVAQTVAWVRDQPRSSDRQQTLGLVYVANGLWKEAALAFSNVARINPEQPLAPLYMAAAAQELGDLPHAAQLLRGLTNRFPGFAPAFSRLGDIALRMGEVDEAELAYNTLIALEPAEPRGYAGLGEVQLRKGQHANAAKNLEKAVELDPEAKGAHNLLGLAYRALGRIEEAKIELTLGLNHVVYPMPDAWSELAPQHMRLLHDQLDLANALGQSNEPEKAVALLEKALTYHPQHLGLLNNLAIAYNRAGRPDQARSVSKKALELDERYLPAHITLSFSFEAMNLHQEAVAAADRAIALSPETTQAHLAKANALLGMERDRDAIAALEAASRSDPKNGEIHVEIGDVYWRNLQDPEKALGHYQAATNLNPSLAAAHVRIADYHIRRGDTNAARPVLLMLRRIAPKNPDLPVLENHWRSKTLTN